MTQNPVKNTRRIARMMLCGLITVAIASPGVAGAQTTSWKVSCSPYFAMPTSIVVDGSGQIIESTDGGGILISTDNGESWQQIDNGLPDLNVESLIINPTDGEIIAGCADGEVCTSLDGGSSWATAGAVPNNETVWSLALDSNRILLAGTSVGIFRSTNGGGNWTEPSGPMSTDQVLSIAIEPDGKIAAGTHASGAFVSSDAGLTWTQSDSGLPAATPAVYSIAVDSLGNVFAGTNQGMFESTDGGGHWFRALSALPPVTTVNAVAVAPTGELLVGSHAGLYVSSDDGVTWHERSVSPDSLFVRCFAFKPGGYIFAGTFDDGTFISSDAGSTWTQLITGMYSNAIVSSIASGASGSMFAGFEGNTVGAAIFRSTNSGGSWTESGFRWTSLGANDNFVYCIVADTSGDVFAGTRSRGVQRSTDNGETWVQTNQGLDSSNVYSLAIGAGGEVFAGTPNGVYRSGDNGNTWSQSGLLNYSVTALSIGPGGYVVAGATSEVYPDSSGIFRAAVTGGGWSEVADLPHSRIQSIVTNRAGDFLAATEAPESYSGSNGVFRSGDNGSTWLQIDSNLVNSNGYSDINAVAADSEGDVFAGDLYSGVFELRAGTGSWTEIDSGLAANAGIWSVEAGPGNTAFAGTGNGAIYESVNSITAVRGTSDINPSGFELRQNFPNPFNPTTEISYKLSAISDVTLKVYDILGREVATLVDEKQNAGKYSVTFDGSRLSSGVYFYRLVAGSFASVKKLLLLK